MKKVSIPLISIALAIGIASPPALSSPGPEANPSASQHMLQTATTEFETVENLSVQEYFANQISAGDTHSCAVLSEGRVFCWGNNERGQLGNGAFDSSSNPVEVVGLDGAIAVSAGGAHSCAVTELGKVFCWGYGSDGQLGNGAFDSSSTPVEVVGLSGVVSLSTTGSHTCAQTQDGQAYCWGYGPDGQLGDGMSQSSNVPVLVAELSDVISISAGGAHSCAVTADGQVHCWGWGGYGQLGDGDREYKATPVQVGNNLGDARMVSAGYFHTCAIDSGGDVQCWGFGAGGQLGNGRGEDSNSPDGVSILSNVTSLSSGYYHTCATLSSGETTCWGSGDFGRLGNGSSSSASEPVLVSSNQENLTVAAGGSHSCALSMEGDIECWGWGEYGQLGNGADRNTSSPKMVLISLVDRAPVVEKTGYPAVGQTITAEVNIWEPISWRLGHTYTWFDSTGIRSFESNSTVISDQDFAKWIGVHVQISDNGGELFGEISLGLRSVSDWPVVDLESDSPAISAFQIDAGSAHTCSVAAWGELSCWGDGSFGQTGTGYLGDDGLDAPAMVTPPQQALGVSSGGAHSCYVSISGGLYCWGHNGSGQLGDETNQDSSVPVSVTRFEYDWIAVAAGGSHTCGLDVEGNVFCWGDNAHGQLGIGGTTNSSYPRYVNLPGPAKSISIGGHHSCATLESLIYCWGRNNYGQLGNGSTISSQLPVQVTLVTDDATLSLGYAHSCAVTSGDIYCWGSNESGQLGREGVSSSSPEQVVGVVEARQVSAGSTYSCAIQVSGEVLCWGNNSSGQLGTGGTSNASIPVRADIAERAIFVTGYDTHTCASLYDGAVQCWGGNAVGQLGTGNRVDYLVPELSQMPTFEFEDLHPRLVGSAQLGETIQVDIVDGPWFVRELQKDLTTNHWIASKSLSVLRNLTIEDSLSSSPSLVLDGMLAGKRIAAFVEITVPGFDTQVLRTNYIYLPFGYLTLIGEPSISGETETGATLTLNPGNWDEGVTFSAEWVSGAMPVADSDGLEYVLSDRDADKRIWAVVTASKVGYHPVTVSTFETASVELVQPLAQASAPTIRGTTRVGATATVRNGSWDPGVNFSYQWLRNGQRISGANQGTYVFQPEDLNQAISLELVGKKPGFRTTRRDSAPVSVSIGLLAKTPIPQIAGDTSIGSTLTANPGVWDEGVTFEYQWLRSNRAITGATDSAYSLTSLDKGAKISVRVLGSKTGFTSVTKTSPQTGLVASAFVVSPTPQISGIVEVGKVLKVVAGTWNPKPKLTYKWLCNGATIRGATKSTFKLASLQLGCEISVAVTASKAGYAATTRTSAAVLVLRKKNWL